MRKNSRRKLSGAVRDETLAEVQPQGQEVSSRDKSAISPDTDAVPMRRWRTDSILEEASQYHPDRARSFNFHLLTEALGSQDPDFIWGLVSQLSQASTRFNDGEGLNFMLSVIKNIHPRDSIEAMLGAQMAAVHMSMMNYVDEFARLGVRCAGYPGWPIEGQPIPVDTARLFLRAWPIIYCIPGNERSRDVGFAPFGTEELHRHHLRSAAPT